MPPCRGSDDAGRRSSGTTTTTRRPPGRRRRRSKMERRRSPRQRNRTNFLSAGDQLVAHDESLGRRLGARTERRRRARITATEHYYYPSSPLLHQNVRSRNAEKDTRKEEGNARAKEKQTRQRGALLSGFHPRASLLHSRLRRHRKTNCAAAGAARLGGGTGRKRGEDSNSAGEEEESRTTPNQSACRRYEQSQQQINSTSAALRFLLLLEFCFHTGPLHRSKPFAGSKKETRRKGKRRRLRMNEPGDAKERGEEKVGRT